MLSFSVSILFGIIYFVFSPTPVYADHCFITVSEQVEYGKPYTIRVSPSGNPGRLTAAPKYPLTITGKDVALPGGKIELQENSQFDLSTELGPGSYDLSVILQEVVRVGVTIPHVGCQASFTVIESTDPDIATPTPLPTLGAPLTGHGFSIEPPASTINGYTPSVTVSFFGLIPNSDNYQVCYETNANECERPQKKKDKSSNENGIISLNNICGDGPGAVKEAKSKCNEDKDYFHEGNVYSIHLFEKDTASPIISAQFYIRRTYPDVKIADGININISISEDTPILLINGASKNDHKDNEIKINNPITVSLSQKMKIGGEKRNNFQLVLEGIDNKYKSEVCQKLSSNGTENGTLTAFFNNSLSIVDRNSAGGQIIPAGKYLLKINEQINDGGGYDFLRNDDCQGGFTYYHIPINVVIEDDESNSKKILNTYIDTRGVRFDPNESEYVYARDVDKNSPLPCEQWEDMNGVETDDPSEYYRCKTFHTAIGPFGTKPLDFINKLGSWLLAIGGIAAIVFMVYSGYIIMTSRGDKEKIANAREIMTSAVTGLIFIILSITILEIIGIDILRIPGFER